jgi:sugar/nucleoside kinase (ribokinase family)
MSVAGALAPGTLAPGTLAPGTLAPGTLAPGTLAIGIGEILWDRLPTGDEIGGAPFNVVSHLARLGHQTSYLTAVGEDPEGAAALGQLMGREIDPGLLGRVADIPTGLAEVTIGAGGSPEFVIRRPAAFEYWAEFESWAVCAPGGDPQHGAGPGGGAARILAAQPAVLIFGTLAQLRPQARSGLASIVAGCPDAVRLYDVNLRDGWWTVETVLELITLASIVKLSDGEARLLAPILGVPATAAGDSGAADAGGAESGGAESGGAESGLGESGVGKSALREAVSAEAASGDSASGEFDVARFGMALAERYGLRGVAVTAGPDPAFLLLDGVVATAPPPPANVVDAVGAGDAFAAGLLDAVGAGLPAPAALRRANALGTLIASQRGAQPPWDLSELTALEQASAPD